ncbi:MAG: hypothetical protein HYX47_11185 [Burkholderiales bacterium]|nr:hypothetical protein [Burkholderiales bacterium]
MNTSQFSTAATSAIDAFDSTARTLIDSYRDGGERLGDALAQRWNAALKESAPQLKPEVRKNAAHAQKVVAGYYSKGLQLSASGAEVAVNTMVQVATVAVGRAAALAEAAAQRKAA